MKSGKLILSASRRTDIPAFYCNWFYDKIKKGKVYIRNPFNKNQARLINLSTDDILCLVFWTKNPQAFLKDISLIKNFNYYFQYTLNNYPPEIESSISHIDDRIESFKRLSDIIGSKRVIWRYDPIFFTDKIDIEFHIESFNYIASRLSGYTQQCITSILTNYKKTERNLSSIDYRIPNNDEFNKLINNISPIAEQYNISLKGCSIPKDYILKSLPTASCIDSQLIEQISGEKTDIYRDTNQRENCNCIKSFDIGIYDTCIHKCLYCYGTTNHKLAKNTHSKHKSHFDFIDGDLTGTEKISNPKRVETLDDQLTLF